MGSNQLYSLTWGEFGTSLVSAVQLLRCHGDLTDVTLAAGGRSFPAHKLVLCAASPFLLNLLKSTPCQHPVVMLAGVTAQDLEALLEFMYRGEVSVDPNQLPSLLQAAHCLNIQGLAPGTISSEKNEDVPSVPGPHEALTRDVINSFLPIRRRKRTKRRDPSGSGGKWPRQDAMGVDAENRPMEQQMPGVAPPEQESLIMPDAIHRPNDRTDDTEGTHTQSGDEPAMGGGVVVETGGGKVRSASDQPGACPLCGSMLRQARNLRRHLLTSCKYRMMQPAGGASSVAALHGSSSNQSCEEIVCKVSPLPSPISSPVPSPMSSSSCCSSVMVSIPAALPPSSAVALTTDAPPPPPPPPPSMAQ